jgi:hypothetical protein
VTPSARLDGIERLLAERGRTVGRVRVATGRSGVAVGFPRDPMLHVSWAVLAGAGLAGVLLLRRRRRRR